MSGQALQRLAINLPLGFVIPGQSHQTKSCKPSNFCLALVWPAAQLPERAAFHGAKIIQINVAPTPLDGKAHYNFKGTVWVTFEVSTISFLRQIAIAIAAVDRLIGTLLRSAQNRK